MLHVLYVSRCKFPSFWWMSENLNKMLWQKLKFKLNFFPHYNIVFCTCVHENSTINPPVFGHINLVTFLISTLESISSVPTVHSTRYNLEDWKLDTKSQPRAGTLVSLNHLKMLFMKDLLGYHRNPLNENILHSSMIINAYTSLQCIWSTGRSS